MEITQNSCNSQISWQCALLFSLKYEIVPIKTEFYYLNDMVKFFWMDAYIPQRHRVSVCPAFKYLWAVIDSSTLIQGIEQVLSLFPAKEAFYSQRSFSFFFSSLLTNLLCFSRNGLTYFSSKAFLVLMASSLEWHRTRCVLPWKVSFVSHSRALFV